MKYFLLTTITVMLFGLTSFNGLRRATSVTCITTTNEYQNQYTKTMINTFIREVFAGHADELVFNSTSGRLELITEFLSRVKVVSKPELTGKKFPLLSGLKLQNKFNPNLKRDTHFDASTFNPLKYNFPMASKSKTFYRIDNTDYLIIIDPVK